MAARLARRQEDARRKSEEDAAKRILEEQSKALAANKPVDAEHVAVPDVIIPNETPEEQVSALVLVEVCDFTFEILEERDFRISGNDTADS